MLATHVQASYLCSPKLIRERSSTKCLQPSKKGWKKSTIICGRIRKVYIFACPDKKRDKKVVLRVGKRVRPRGSVRFVTLSLTIFCNRREVL